MGKQHTFFAIVLTLLTVASAQGQTVTSLGVGLGYDCFVHAKAGTAFVEGIKICTSALRQAGLSLSDEAATYDNRGVLLNAMGRSDDAQQDFHEAIRLRPALGDAYVNLGSVLIKKKEFDAAIVQINTGIAFGVSYPQIGYYDRALAQELLGRYREAYYDYKKTLELEPDFAPASERLKDFVVTRSAAGTPK